MPFVILTVVFVVLKLTGAINWSWIWISSPLWIPAAVFAIMFLVTYLGAALINKRGHPFEPRYRTWTWVFSFGMPRKSNKQRGHIEGEYRLSSGVNDGESTDNDRKGDDIITK